MNSPDSRPDRVPREVILFGWRSVHAELARQGDEFVARMMQLRTVVHASTPSEPFDRDEQSEGCRNALRSAAVRLEAYVLLAVIGDGCRDRKVRTFSDFDAIAQELVLRAVRTTGLNPDSLAEFAKPMESGPAPDPSAEFPDLIAFVADQIERFPHEALKRFAEEAAELKIEAECARCERALQQARGVLARSSLRENELLRVFGRQYVAGEVEISGVAAALGVSKPRAIALLEAHEYWRVPTAMTPKDIKARLAKVREQRLAGHRPSATGEGVARSVIASQRIEGVDATWLMPEDSSK